MFTSQKKTNFRSNCFRRRTENFIIIKNPKKSCKSYEKYSSSKKIEEIQSKIDENLKLINKTKKNQNGLKEVLNNVQKKVFTLSINFKEIEKIKRNQKNFKSDEEEDFEKTKRKYNKGSRRNKINKRRNKKEKEADTDIGGHIKKK